MIESLSLSVLAGAITTYIVPKALEKVGEKVGETALAKSGEAIQATRRAVQEKMRTTRTDGVLAMAEADPSKPNLQMLETVLLGQLQQDSDFATRLQGLLQQIQAESPGLQVVLDTVRIRGSAEIGDIQQVSETGTAEQIVGRNLGVGGDLKLGDITQQQ
ncbi:MAG: Fis family transcriptional regulator [Elainella sp.]